MENPALAGNIVFHVSFSFSFFCKSWYLMLVLYAKFTKQVNEINQNVLGSGSEAWDWSEGLIVEVREKEGKLVGWE